MQYYPVKNKWWSLNKCLILFCIQEINYVFISAIEAWQKAHYKWQHWADNPVFPGGFSNKHPCPQWYHPGATTFSTLVSNILHQVVMDTSFDTFYLHNLVLVCLTGQRAGARQLSLKWWKNWRSDRWIWGAGISKHNQCWTHNSRPLAEAK